MKQVRYRHSITRIHDKIYCAGGLKTIRGKAVCLKSFEIYSVTDNKWTKGPDLDNGGLISLTSVKNKFLYAVGGSD